MAQKVSDFKAMQLRLASPEEILSWSHGEVLKPETINYRTQRFEKDGLFCEKIFGPSKDWECYCGKYKRIRYKGVVCDKCGVEVTRSIVRRERMGHISLAVPVAHIWYLKGTPSRIGLILDMSSSDLEKVIYFASYIIISVNEDEKQKALLQIDKEYKAKIDKIKVEEKDTKERKKQVEELKKNKKSYKEAINSLEVKKVISEIEYRNISYRYGHIFEAGIGAEAIQKVLTMVDYDKEIEDMKSKLKNDPKGLEKKKILKRLRLVKGVKKAEVRAEWMLVTIVPVVPPDLRPMVQLDGGRFATSDLNDLYRRIINRNNRLKKLLLIGAPEVICRNEKRMLQEAVDALFDNSARKNQVSVVASTGQKRPLKSLADMLKGKQGRFRQNLLGKRVDYSGRSVIVIGSNLKINECGLPKKMALELFKPFIIEKLIKKGLAYNVRNAGRLIEQETEEAYDILEEVIKNHPVLLNRAPTLHRLGIQTFQPILIEGKSIQVHPLVCSAFNADFDGDQMAVHLPLTEEAKKEAREIMISKKNILKPSTGEPIAIPTLDIVLGVYYMTGIDKKYQKKEEDLKYVASKEQAVILYQMEKIGLREEIKVKLEENDQEVTQTTVGRILFNEVLPEKIEFINERLNKRRLKEVIAQLFEFSSMEEVAEVVDSLKDLGFKYATKSGISWGMKDIQVPKNKKKHIEEAEKKLKALEDQYYSGLLTEDERKVQVIQVWNSCKDQIAEEVENEIDTEGPVFSMVDSGARGSMSVLVQLMGMRGLMSNPRGDIIELPVRDSFKEGLNVLEYFISSHGARKGMADTALRTATAGYLTRRLVDVAQDVIVRQEDCGTEEGSILYKEDTESVGGEFASRIEGRVALKDILEPKTKEILVKAEEVITKKLAKKVEQADVREITIRSVVYCHTKDGVCAKCYGYDLGKNKLVKLGQAVGTIAAQSIGEPGTQLTMRTFHAGGIAAEDIVSGLPRVEEIFEARIPKGEALISEFDGTLKKIESDGKQKKLIIAPDKEKEVKTYTVSDTTTVLVEEKSKVKKGQQLTAGHIDLKKLFKLTGLANVHRYITREIQEVYSSQGESIDDKHIEIIVRQMFSRKKVIDSGDSSFVAGEVINSSTVEEINDKLKKEGKNPMKIEDMILGITKVSLSTDSFLSAASFMHTAQVLIDASLQGKVDQLKGLKENVILGKLIPAGTGYQKDNL
jgi:DNA-directed RNA polymerase subunit beta'